jgi:XTP/dITP diphosphohydrolase
MRKLLEDTLIIATHNDGKLQEISKLLENHTILVHSSASLNLKEPEETENTFVGNARIKAHYASSETNFPALADDSGIEVECLNGAPGVYTADWAETTTGRDFDMAMEKLWAEVQKTGAQKPFNAQFCSTLVLAWPDGHDEVFEGKIKGQLVWPICGTNGHGFDPMFLPDGFDLTFGEMNRWEKNKLSHRGLAFTKLIKNCFSKKD